MQMQGLWLYRESASAANLPVAPAHPTALPVQAVVTKTLLAKWAKFSLQENNLASSARGFDQISAGLLESAARANDNFGAER